MYTLHWHLDTYMLSIRHTAHDCRCINTDCSFFFFIHSNVYTNCNFQSTDRSIRPHNVEEWTKGMDTSQPISFINSTDDRKQLNIWAYTKGSNSNLYAQRNAITCFFCEELSHFYGFIFIYNSLFFRWSQKSSICTLNWAEVLILFFANTFTLWVHTFFVCDYRKAHGLWVYDNVFLQIISIIFVWFLQYID